MTKSNSKSGGSGGNFLKTPMGKLSLLVVALLVVGVLHFVVLTIIAPLAMGDGVSRYTGASKEAAKMAIDNTYSLIDNKSRWGHIVYTNDVHATTAAEKAQYCTGDRARVVTDPNDPHFYTVVVNIKQLFTYSQASTQVQAGCSSSPAAW